MRCIESMPVLVPALVPGMERADALRRRLLLGTALAGTGWLVGCAVRPAAPPEPPAPLPPAVPTPGAAPPVQAPPPAAALPPPVAARSWEEFQLQAARRLVAASPGRSYTGAVPEPLLAIPVLEVELHADGSVRAIKVLRTPSQARDTIELAKAAVLRAAPYGAMSRLPRPWTFVEVFLFDDERRFKPRTLDR